ncbi:alpha/beta hydrolase-fold protein [Phytoactinopolyspora halotolerans]|uniref:Esterase n=1 Tax=Phytoactinopolyspora halotolerans TaxID=1981512 RepID=A0A6L9SAP4_9ACTN|nr:alpha/beta hydrolase-fold protein [Phytoactinopolyspora halotolerans]NEE01694.1 esterase [Phytoactinopolyspora halotolerans]
MVIASRQRPLRRPAVHRRVAAFFVTALVIAATLIAVRPAAADTPWLSVSDDGFATFSVPADYVQDTVGDASQVVAEGNFGPGSNWAELGLARRGGAWTAVIGPLEPGLYYYQITADDTKTFKDPTNPTTVESEPEWSTFLIAGDSAELLADVPDGQGGTVETMTYRSKGARETRSALVWTPPGYDPARKEPYPVLYLQHGGGQSYRDWVEVGRAQQIFDNLTIRGDMEPMVVVMGNGNVQDFQKELFQNIMRAARHEYNISHKPSQQALAGLSMGGYQTLSTLFDRPGRFAYVGSFAGFGDASDVNANAINQGTTLLRLYTGNVTDLAYNANYRLMNELDEAGVEYEFDGVNPDAGHNWDAWQENLIDFAQRLFREVPDHGPSPGHLPLDSEFTTPPAGTTPTPWLSEDAEGNTFVTFETTTEFADAEHVTVWGNWAPGGSWTRVELSRAGDRWRGTMGPLEPGFYHYRLIVDMQAVKDTGNPTSITSEPTWSTFLVPGESARMLTDVPDGQGGDVHEMTYHSSVAGGERTSYVWTPPGYDPGRDEPYPVFFLQHGGGQNYTDWIEMGRAKQILDNHFLDGNLEPMVVVMSNGNVSNFTAELLDNIVPATHENYNVSDDPSRRALAGLSMGGGQTYGVLKSHPGEFAYIGVFSAGFGSAEGVDADAINDGTTLLKLYVGDVTDFVYPGFMTSLETMDQLGIEYEFDGPTPGPHGWDVWQKNLVDFAPLLFKQG